jgi:hypothetical protein
VFFLALVWARRRRHEAPPKPRTPWRTIFGRRLSRVRENAAHQCVFSAASPHARLGHVEVMIGRLPALLARADAGRWSPRARGLRSGRAPSRPTGDASHAPICGVLHTRCRPVPPPSGRTRSSRRLLGSALAMSDRPLTPRWVVSGRCRGSESAGERFVGVGDNREVVFGVCWDDGADGCSDPGICAGGGR